LERGWKILSNGTKITSLN